MTTARQTSFGRWTLNTENGCLEINFPGGVYQVPLEDLTTSARILDQIFQVSDKPWFTAGDVGDFARAIGSIFDRGIVGGGINHPFDAKDILKTKYGCKLP